jgi:hypothetical protein
MRVSTDGERYTYARGKDATVASNGARGEGSSLIRTANHSTRQPELERTGSNAEGPAAT